MFGFQSSRVATGKSCCPWKAWPSCCHSAWRRWSVPGPHGLGLG